MVIYVTINTLFDEKIKNFVALKLKTLCVIFLWSMAIPWKYVMEYKYIMLKLLWLS